MLQRKAISPLLGKSLDILMKMKSLEDFRLVGGTALALQIGHRRSIDIDLFSDKYTVMYNFDSIFREAKENLKKLGELCLSELTSTGLICKITNKEENVNLDFWKWPNPFIRQPNIEEGIRMAGLDDLAAMKLEAINDRSNYRDYVDLAFLSDNYSFSQMMNLYTERTLSHDNTRIIKALSNPDDLVMDQQLHFLTDISEIKLKEKVDYMLFVYTKEKELEKNKK